MKNTKKLLRRNINSNSRRFGAQEMKLPQIDLGILNTKRYLLLINWMLLIIHSVLLVSLYYCRAYSMSYVNIFSVILYALSFILIHEEKYRTYIIIAYLEVWTHLIFAVIFLGWDMGFQMYCFLLVPLIFFAFYIGVVGDRSLLTPIVASLIDILTFLFARFYTLRHDPIYMNMFTEGQLLFFYLFNLFIVFSGLILNMAFFAGHAVSSERELHDLAEYDELTGLYNRRFIRRVLDEVYIDFVKNGKLFAVSITDIDDFKIVNDTFGHDAGDYVLQIIGNCFKQMTPDNACIGRWGGEEFIVVFHGDDCGYEKCCANIDKIRRKIETYPIVYEGNEISLTITAGIAMYEEGMSITDIVREADARLYQGKADGKNITICQ
jgi:diguanylate cyclase (GGDEF)-like protein